MKSLDFMFLNKIEACHLNNHSQKNEINVVRTFPDIEIQSWPLIYEWDKIYDASDVCTGCDNSKFSAVPDWYSNDYCHVLELVQT